jgi:uncharacterized protein involved in response to NO
MPEDVILNILCLLQNVDNQEQLFKFLSLFAGSLSLVASYAWFGQQVIDEVWVHSLHV